MDLPTIDKQIMGYVGQMPGAGADSMAHIVAWLVALAKERQKALRTTNLAALKSFATTTGDKG